MNPNESYDSPGVSDDRKMFFETLHTYRTLYSRLKPARQGRTAYEAKRYVDAQVAPRVVHESTWLTVPLNEATAEFFLPQPDAQYSGMNVWMMTKCPVCGDIGARMMSVDVEHPFETFATFLASCKRCYTFFYAVDGLVQTPEDEPWTEETKQDSLGQDSPLSNPGAGPEQIRFFNALREYRNRYSEIKAAREGRSAQAFYKMVSQRMTILNMDKQQARATEAPNTAGITYFTPFDNGISQSVWVKTKCPNCGDVSAYSMHISSKRGLLGGFSASIARCRHCNAHFYTADGIVENTDDEPWTAATSQDSLGRIADRWKGTHGSPNSGTIILAVTIVLLLIIGLLAAS